MRVDLGRDAGAEGGLRPAVLESAPEAGGRADGLELEGRGALLRADLRLAELRVGCGRRTVREPGRDAHVAVQRELAGARARALSSRPAGEHGPGSRGGR